MKLNPLTVVCCVLFTCIGTSLFNRLNAQLFINEIIASNNTGQMDDFNDHDDWIEIYNMSGVVNMAGYYVTDDPNNLTKYMIPFGFDTETFVPPNSYFIIWADKDTLPSQGPTHVNFTLSVDGESVLLVAPDGSTIIDQVTYPQMVTDISYGRETDAASNWVYFNNVTFEASNGELDQAPEILFINEVQTDNVSTFPDTFNEFEQWFEIYNPNPYPVNVADYYISNTADPLLFRIPNTNPYRTVIPANGFGLIWCDGQTEQDSNHGSFTLNSTGTITLTSPDGNTTVDSYNYNAMGPDQSWGRSSDGGVSSILFGTPTPRVTNQLIIIQPELLYINELLAKNIADTVDNYLEHEDWFEIYNPNNYPVDISGYYFTDNPENSMKWQVPSTFPDSVTVPANGWLLFWADEDGVQGVRHTSFKLSNNGEILNFYSPDGFSLVDHIDWVYIAADTSLGRITDGSPTWWNFIGTTPEYSNNGGVLNLHEGILSQQHFAIWPNPSSRMIRTSETTDLYIYSMEGKLVHSEYSSNTVDVGFLAPGMYLIRNSKGDVARLVRE